MERLSFSAGLSLSRIAYGLWRLADDADTSPKHIQAKLEACLDQGLTTIDQADIYGDYGAEALFGACLRQAPHLRGKIEIITKCDIVAPCGRHSQTRVKHYDTSAAHISASVEHSLRLMAIDQIDLLLIHRPDPFMDHNEAGLALDALVTSGKVRCVGVSNFRPWDFALLQSAMRSPLVTNQIELGLMSPDAFTNGDLAFLQERAIVPMAWSPLGGGRLVSGNADALAATLDTVAKRIGVDAAAMAVAWLLAHPAQILPVVGTNQISRIRALSAAARIKIDRETWFELYTAAIGRDVA